MKYLITILCFMFVYSIYGQNQGFTATQTENHKILVSGSERLDINVQHAHITIKAWSNDYMQVNIKMEAKHRTDKSKVDKEIAWSKCNIKKVKDEISLSNSIILPKGVKGKPQCKHVIHMEILMPKIEDLKINLNIGSLVLDNIKSKINIQTKLCKTILTNCELKGDFNQTLGESNTDNCTLNGNFIFVNVISKFNDVGGNFNLDATDSKINVSQQENTYSLHWDILRSEINWVTSHNKLPTLKFVLNQSELNIPASMKKQQSKFLYNFENKSSNSVFNLKAQNSFVHIYNN